MCGRYTMTVDQRTIEHRFGAKFTAASRTWDCVLFFATPLVLLWSRKM
jgi:hypothetical protein